MLSTLWQQITAAGPLDWLALVTSLVYVILAARNNNWCWLFAAVSTAVWAWQSFVVYQLVSDGFLQVFYFVMAGVGLWRWRSTNRAGPSPAGRRSDVLDEVAIPETTQGTITRMTALEHVLTVGLGLLSGWILYMFVSGVFVSAATLPDAVTTAFSIVTTFLLISRRLENWLYWIIIDLAYVWIYYSQGAALFAVMMVINVGVAAYGFVNWRRKMAGSGGGNSNAVLGVVITMSVTQVLESYGLTPVF